MTDLKIETVRTETTEWHPTILFDAACYAKQMSGQWPDDASSLFREFVAGALDFHDLPTYDLNQDEWAESVEVVLEIIHQWDGDEDDIPDRISVDPDTLIDWFTEWEDEGAIEDRPNVLFSGGPGAF
jgi:hypothetical protein